jgi:GntR family transcriptional regulator/MocR family aminotransferase
VKKVPRGTLPLVAVDRKAPKPLHKQIYDAYRTAIVSRGLRPGQQLPSTRALATELGVSRIPVLNAYEQLIAEGYFETRLGAGTFVSSSLPDQLISSERRPDRANAIRSGPRLLSRRCASLPNWNGFPSFPGAGAFSSSEPAYDHFPLHVWSNLVARHSRKLRVESLHYGNPMGSLAFRETIATYLRTSRAARCEADQIIVVSGSQQALDISARALLDPGSPVWVEDPGYIFAKQVLTTAGARLVPVAVDNEGLDVAAGIKQCRQARAAFVTPSHQYPLGVTMSASRRLQLLEWAQSLGSWIVEDDYDSEYRYESMPIASLQGLDRHARVIYIGTFSKVLFSSLRLGYMVVPPDLVDRFSSVRLSMDLGPPDMYQAVLTDFISEGHFARHIRRMRLLYAERRSALVASLHKELGPRFEVLGGQAGMHFAVTLPPGFHDQEITVKAARQNLCVWPLSPAYLGNKPRQGLLLGFGNTAVEDIPANVRKLRDVLSSA